MAFARRNRALISGTARNLNRRSTTIWFSGSQKNERTVSAKVNSHTDTNMPSTSDRLTRSLPSAPRRTHFFFAAVAYTAFVIYGSLVPFYFHPLGWKKVWNISSEFPCTQLVSAAGLIWLPIFSCSYPSVFSGSPYGVLTVCLRTFLVASLVTIPVWVALRWELNSFNFGFRIVRPRGTMCTRNLLAPPRVQAFGCCWDNRQSSGYAAIRR